MFIVGFTAGLIIDSLDTGPVCSVTSLANAFYLGIGRQCVSTQYPVGFCADSDTNPDAGFSNFDTFPNAMLNNFVAITGEGWSFEMYVEWLYRMILCKIVEL